MATSPPLPLIRLHRDTIRQLLTVLGLGDIRITATEPHHLLVLPDADVPLGDFLDAQDALRGYLGSEIELVSVRSEYGQELAVDAVALRPASRAAGQRVVEDRFFKVGACASPRRSERVSRYAGASGAMTSTQSPSRTGASGAPAVCSSIPHLLCMSSEVFAEPHE